MAFNASALIAEVFPGKNDVPDGFDVPFVSDIHSSIIFTALQKDNFIDFNLRISEDLQVTKCREGAVNQSYRVLDEIVSRNNKDGTVIVMKLDDSNVFFKIDGLAARVWKEIAGKNSLADLKTEILNEYNTDEETLNRDISLLLADLQKNNLIVAM